MIAFAETTQPAATPAARTSTRPTTHGAAVTRAQCSAMSRNDVLREIKAALKARTGRTWSVTGGRGTAYGWLTIDAPKSQRTWTREETGTDGQGFPVYTLRRLTDAELQAGRTGIMSDGCRLALARVLGLDLSGVHQQGISIPSGSDWYAVYLNRARLGHANGCEATRDWD